MTERVQKMEVQSRWMAEERICRETIRYLGYREHRPDPQMEKLIAWGIHETEQKSVPAFIVQEFTMELGEKHRVRIGDEAFISQNLSRNLQDCEKVLLLAATLGAQVDRLIQKYSRLDMAKAVILQAAAAAILEEYCDEKNRELQQKAEEQGWYFRPRFSPGYGDFPIDFQKPLLAMLSAQKRIGVTTTESGMLVPVKSVTAVIGMSRRDTKCRLSGCETCGKRDCIYRRSTSVPLENAKEE